MSVLPEEEEELPTLPKGLAVIFEYLEKNATDGVWFGYAREISEALKLKLPKVYYTLNVLQVCGCIEKLKHGSGSNKSAYRLLKQPNYYDYNLVLDRQDLTNNLVVPSRQQRNADSINRLNARVARLEEQIGEILQWIRHSTSPEDVQDVNTLER